MRKVLISGMIGNGLEWYDYALYAYMATIISKLFFPIGNDDLHMLATFGIFAVGFVARPFGGVFFGYIGDKYGRRASFAASILMMSIPTACIGLLPTYAQIGIAAPLLLTLLRLLQGLSLGGAFCGSMTYVVEHAPPSRRGLAGSSSIVSLVIGFLAGSFIALAIKANVSEADYETWGWRIPFILGIVVGLAGFYVRHACEESPVYEQAKRGGALSTQPVRDAFRRHPKAMLESIGIYMLVTMPFYLLSSYLITYTKNTLERSTEEALALNTINMLILLVASPFSAWLSDRIGRRRFMIPCAVVFLLVTWPLFHFMAGATTIVDIALAQAAFALLVGLYIGPVPAILVESFPTSVRYTGMAMSYNVSAGLFGGTAPMVCEWMLQTFHSIAPIAMYVMLCAIIALLALWKYKDRYRDALE
jgi:MHS family proline/betaine transporter-like MFS transporter